MSLSLAGLRRNLLNICLCVTLVLVPMWWRLPNAPGGFEFGYPFGFVFTWCLIVAVFLWTWTGARGLGALWQDRLSRVWVICLVLLVMWCALSGWWSFMRARQPQIAPSAALQMGLTAIFMLILATGRPSYKVIVLAVCIGLVFSSLVAVGQVSQQQSLGLHSLGELRLDPADSGVSVVQAAGVRWLRPYGLLPHPNILAGYLGVGLLLLLPLLTSRRVGLWWGGTSLFLFALWALLLTFSRAAWGGVIIGGAVWWVSLLLFQRRHIPFTQLMVTFGLALLVVLLFVLLYSPFLLARAGITTESIEQRSVSDRIVYNQIAFEVIERSPIIGIGVANYQWYAARYLAGTDMDLKGQPVHNIYLLLWTELGLIGLVLFAGILLLGGVRILRQVRRGSGFSMEQASYLGATVLMLAVGWLDHYPLTLLIFRTFWLGLFALAVFPPDQDVAGA